MDIFIAILEDRHYDDTIEVFVEPIMALKIITEWKARYPDEEWVERDVPEWEYCVDSEDDDGPKIRIEKKVLKWPH